MRRDVVINLRIAVPIVILFASVSMARYVIGFTSRAALVVGGLVGYLLSVLTMRYVLPGQIKGRQGAYRRENDSVPAYLDCARCVDLPFWCKSWMGLELRPNSGDGWVRGDTFMADAPAHIGLAREIAATSVGDSGKEGCSRESADAGARKLWTLLLM